MMNGDMKRKIDTLRDLLVGVLPVPTDQIKQITLALIYKFMSDQNQTLKELGGGDFFSGEYAPYAWTRLMDPMISAAERVKLYRDGLEKMAANPHIPELFREIFRGAYLPFNNPSTLDMFLKGVNEIEYTHSEDLGDAFEHLLSVMGAQGDAGQFRTPRHIIDFIVAAVDPQKGQRVLDPACGTAGFLVSAYRHILKANTLPDSGLTGSALEPDERQRLTDDFCGYDISSDMARLSRVNLYLHLFPDPKIYEYDTLTSLERWDEVYDCVLTNPPFMSPKGGIQPHNRFSIPSKRSEVLFVDYILDHLAPDGRAGIIVPEGIIFQSQNAHKALRKKLVEENFLYAVVSLPAGVFQPYSGVKTSILLIDRALARRSREILFVKVEADGFDLGAQRNPIEKNDLPKAIEVINQFKNHSIEENNLATQVNKEEIGKDGEYSLTETRYRSSDVGLNAIFPHVKLGDVAYFENGYPFKPTDWRNTGKKIIRIQNLTGTNEKYNYYDDDDIPGKYIINKGDLLISWSATIGFFIWNDESAYLNQHIFKVLLSEKVLLKYLYYLKDKVIEMIISKVHGNTMRHITKPMFLDLEIPLPPLEVQREIVDEIEGYQKIIDGARQVVENYKPRIQVDPEWPLVELGEIAKFIQGTQVAKNIQITNEEEGYERFIRIIDYTQNNNDIRYVQKKENHILCKKDDLIMVRYGASAGFIGRGIEGIFANNLFKIEIDQKQILNCFLYYFFMSKMFNNFVKNNVMQAAMPALSHAIMKKLQVPHPTLEIQRNIVKQIEIENKIVNANKELIKMFEKKIEEKIGEVWGEGKEEM